MKQQIDLLVTGGNTAGHVVPLLPIVKIAQHQDWKILFVGSRSGFEEKMARTWNVEYQPISSGKLRRYLSWQNILDVGRVLRGIFDAWQVLRQRRPRVVFSKGGFVSVPVVIAARLLSIPIVAHESDSSFSLSSRIAIRLGATLCTGFPTSCYTTEAGEYTGIPIRTEFAEKPTPIPNLESNKTKILVFFGSLGGSQILQAAVKDAALALGSSFEINHIVTGENSSVVGARNYVPIKTHFDSFDQMVREAAVIVCRAGATTLAELAVLKKRAVLVPLSLNVSRGDQLRNARYFVSNVNSAMILPEAEFSTDTLVAAIRKVVGEPERTSLSDWGKAHTGASMKIFSILEQHRGVAAE